MFKATFVDIIIAIAFVTDLHKQGRKNIIIRSNEYGAVVMYD